MALRERTRHQLYEAARGTLGDAAAETLMELLPPVGWADVATKHDLAALEERLGLRIDGLGLRIDGLGLRIDGLELRICGVEERFTGLLATTEARMEAALHREIGGIATAMARQTRTIMFSLVGMLVGIGSLSIGIGTLT